MSMAADTRRRTRHVLTTVALTVLPLLLTACVPAPPTPSPSPSEPPPSSGLSSSPSVEPSHEATPMPPPRGAMQGAPLGHDVAFGRNGQVWRTRDIDTEILVRTPRGWLTITLPVVPAHGDSVTVSDDTVTAVGFQNGGMVVARSPDLGTTWSTSPVLPAQYALTAALAVSPATGRLVVGAQYEHSSGAVAPPSPAFVGDGATMTAITMPGNAAFAGWAGDTLLSPGGGTSDRAVRLSISKDSGATWTDLTKAITGAEPPDHDVPADQPYFAPVLSLGDGTAVVLLVAGSDTTGLSVRVLRLTPDGNYADLALLTLPSNTEGGFGPLVSSTYGPDAVIVSARAIPTLQVVRVDGTVTLITPSGLPSAPDAISFQDTTNGLARVTVSECRLDKPGCTTTSTTYVTTDGGHTWDVA